MVLDRLVEAGSGPARHTVGTDDLGSYHTLADGTQQDADARAYCAVGDREPALEPSHQNGQRHERRVHDEGELPRVEHHHRGRHHDLSRVDDQDHPAPLQELGDLVDVTGDPRGQRAPAL